MGENQLRQDDAQFVGSVGCRSSSCHGGAGEKRSQFITWSQKDFHTRGFSILLDNRSARIAEAAGIANPSGNSRCTICHSPFAAVPPERLGPGARIDEGVSCENCHGAAGPWLRGHTRPDWTYAMRVTAGMHDLRSLYVRANACVACHQTLDADILQAGHPPLVFEMDSQSVNEPRHWRDEDPSVGPRCWLVGQAVALRECAWRSRTDKNASADVKQTATALGWMLAKISLVDPSLPKIVQPTSSDCEGLQEEADGLARRAVTWDAKNDVIMSILRALGDTHREFVSPTQPSDESLHRAVRITLALERLSQAIVIKPEAAKEMVEIRRSVDRPYDFDPAAFAGHLRLFREKL